MPQLKNTTTGAGGRPCFWCVVIFCLATLVMVAGVSPAAAKESPTIRLFPTTVIENIKQTGQAAKAMEQDLQSVIG